VQFGALSTTAGHDLEGPCTGFHYGCNCPE
jgi:hypothetical protein